MASLSYLRAEHNAEPGAPEDPELPGEHGLLGADVAAVVLPVWGGGWRLGIGRGELEARLGIVVGQGYRILKSI